METDQSPVSRDQLIERVGEVALTAFTLPDRATLTSNLLMTGKSKWLTQHFFPRIARYGSKEVQLVDFVLTMHTELDRFREDFGMVSSTLNEERMPRYLGAVLKDAEPAIKQGANAIWLNVVEMLYGKEARQAQVRSASEQFIQEPETPVDWRKLPRKKKKAFKQRHLSQRQLSAYKRDSQ